MHVYKREFSMSEGTYFFLPAGEAVACFEIGFPPEGKITRLIVRQNPGDAAAVGFTVNLLDRQSCDLITSGSSVSLEAEDDMTPQLGQIIPTQNAAAGDTMELRSGHGYSYRNREGTFTVPQRSVYLQIGVSSTANDTRWEVSIEGEIGGAAH